MPTPNRTELQKLSKEDMAKAMQQMKSRAERYKKNAEAFSDKLLNTAAGAGAAGFLGHWMGSAEVEFRKLRDDLMARDGLSAEEAEKKILEVGDPRKIVGVDKDLVVSFAALALGWSGLLGKRMSPVLEAAGSGGIAGVAHSFGFDMAMRAAQEEAEQAAA